MNSPRAPIHNWTQNPTRLRHNLNSHGYTVHLLKFFPFPPNLIQMVLVLLRRLIFHIADV